jgi:hypothetical protein
VSRSANKGELPNFIELLHTIKNFGKYNNHLTGTFVHCISFLSLSFKENLTRFSFFAINKVKSYFQIETELQNFY